MKKAKPIFGAPVSQPEAASAVNELQRFGITCPVTISFPESIFDRFEENKIGNDKELSAVDNTLWLNESFFIDKAVPNVWRYNLLRANGMWKLTNPKKGRILRTRNGIERKFHDVKIEPDKKNILLILESPHKDEYEKRIFIPKGPAQGKSGDNIRDQFSTKVLPLLISEGLILDKKKVYRFCIVNPVPFQASLHYFRKKNGNKEPSLDKQLRDVVWRALFARIKQNFLEVIVDSRSEILIVACTGGELKKEGLNNDVYQAMKDIIKDKQVFKTPHPVTWNYLSAFKKLEQ